MSGTSQGIPYSISLRHFCGDELKTEVFYEMKEQYSSAPTAVSSPGNHNRILKCFEMEVFG